jgi:hypothetical protein
MYILEKTAPSPSTCFTYINSAIIISKISLTAFKLLSHIWDRKKGSFFTGVYLPQKSVLEPPIERQYKPFQKHVSSY